MQDPRTEWEQVKNLALRTAASILLPLEIELTQNEQIRHIRAGGDLRFTPMGIDGLQAVHLHSPPGHSCVLVRGLIGSHSEKIRLRQQVEVHCLEGAVLYFIDNHEPILIESKAVNPLGRDRLTIHCNQLYSFVVINACLNYSIFTPEIDFHDTRD